MVEIGVCRVCTSNPSAARSDDEFAGRLEVVVRAVHGANVRVALIRRRPAAHPVGVGVQRVVPSGLSPVLFDWSAQIGWKRPWK